VPGAHSETPKKWAVNEMSKNSAPHRSDKFPFLLRRHFSWFPDVGFLSLLCLVLYFIRNVKCGNKLEVFHFSGRANGADGLLLFHSSRWVWEEAGCLIVRKKGADGMHPMLMDEQVTDSTTKVLLASGDLSFK
jgi:hypothetical protein